MDWSSTLLDNHPFYQRQKNKTVLATWIDTAFQISLQPDGPDPLRIPFFELAGCFAIPQLGIYDQDDYELLPHKLLIELPFEAAALSDHLPHHILQAVEQCEKGQELYIIWYDRTESLDTKLAVPIELNVMMHPWIFASRPQDDLVSDEGLEERIRVGGRTEWVGCNVEEVNNPDLPDILSGFPLNRFGDRLVSMHHGRFSPHNCQIRLSGSPTPLHAFFSVCLHQGKAIVCFHVIPGSNHLNQKLSAVLGASSSLGQLVMNLVQDAELECFKLKILSIIYPITQIYK
eukprot:TRINITY_DN2853_c0_g1_i1.p1 TRINITY_DN2853_c0_g1~~TRINITY_DN2853_c0_g1_i1.p1  ORF type:complete len:288 (-),score=10.26 TRINITY_DN2853_c0_g1_i1:108-971(-)